MKYVEPLFRPPAEADSLIFQAAYGCPHNTCRFCGMYKTVRYRVRDRGELLREIADAGRKYPDTQRVFLADGDVMIFSFAEMREILSELNLHFSSLSRVNVYANGSSIIAKTPEELQELRRLKLNTLYVGLESGDQEILALVNKQEKVPDMIAGVKLAQECGLKCSVMILLGLGGREYSLRHAAKTAEALNAMQPRLLSALRFIEVPGCSMYDGYQTITEYGAVGELKGIISRLELNKTVFRANHSSNPAPLAGRFPNDKQQLIAELDYLLSGSMLDRKGPGRQPFFL
ncbi:MAG: radical SAM protein [Lentisphaerota bacterium]